MMKEKIKRAYNELAPSYFEARMKGGISQFYNEMLEMPNTFKLLGNVKGKKILDLGCGPGRYAKLLTLKGAKVTGIDNSKVSLDIANKVAPKVKFILGDIEKLPFNSGQFDIVLSALVMGHFKNWNKIFGEVKRVLKKNGIFIFSIHNPVKEMTENKSKKIKGYFNEKMLMHIWKEKDKKCPVAHYHKTYGSIIKIIVKNGFEIIDYQDAFPLKKAEKIYPKRYMVTSNVPNFCTWKLRKK